MKTSDRFDRFMKGFVTAVQLSKRAQEKGCFIESVCLAASIIDASLRIALILKHQIEKQSSELLDDLLYQDDKDPIVSERQIYERALNKEIISKEIFQQLDKLYKRRNKVVHRYIISEITTKDVLRIAAQYADLVHIISGEIGKLEKKQIELGIGMTLSDENVPLKYKQDFENNLEEMIKYKHGDHNLTRNLNL